MTDAKTHKYWTDGKYWGWVEYDFRTKKSSLLLSLHSQIVLARANIARCLHQR